MSAYIHFFLRQNDNFMPIGVYCRSSDIYRYFEHYAPWEKVEPLTKEKLEEINKEIKKDINAIKNTIKSLKEDRELVCKFENSVEDKMEKIFELDECLEEKKDYLKDLKEVMNFYNMIMLLYKEASWTESDNVGIIKDKFIYIGIETGYDITKDMIC